MNINIFKFQLKQTILNICGPNLPKKGISGLEKKMHLMPLLLLVAETKNKTTV